jgi:hypothetical protein
MKLKYTEFRPSVNRFSAEETSAEIHNVDEFTKVVLKEVGTCLEFESHDAAHKLLDWHREVYGTGKLTVGQKLVHNYGTGLDPVGTWEIIS